MSDHRDSETSVLQRRLVQAAVVVLVIVFWTALILGMINALS